jgi:dienelactone hydrolase
MIHRNARATWLLTIILLCLSAPARSADRAQIQSWLEREIIGSDISLAEVQWYCDERVPAMPVVENLAQWEAEADRIRAAVLERIAFAGEAARWRDAATRVEWLETIDGGPGYRIRKLRFEALPGLWIPALLYEPEQLSGKVPVVLNVNGHTSLGKQYPPKQIRCINQAKRGMLALNLEWVGMGQLSGEGFDHYRMNQLDLCGTSGWAPFYLNMSRGLDILLSLEHADPERVAVTGLSGGGWQTIVISSLDTRVTLANPVAGHSSFKTRAWHLKDLGDSEQTPNDLATICDYTHLTAMMAPRPTLLTFNLHDDCCFEGAYALDPLLAAAKPIFQLYGREQALRSHVNDDPPGKHNYEVDNRQQFYRMAGDFFFPDDTRFDAREIPSDDEVQSEEALRVELPPDNLDFHRLALQLSRDLPRDGTLPADAAAAVAWQQARRPELRAIVRGKDYEIEASLVEEAESEDVQAAFWKLRMSGQWTVPAVELWRGEPRRTAILVADSGRAGTAEQVAQLLDSGYRVIAADPFYFGESRIAQRDFLFALLVAAVGDRPIGLQASQVAALARWAAARHPDSDVTLCAIGLRSSAFALIAAALEDQAISAVELHDSLGSLKEVIERNWSVSQKPELFCFGLLESFDVRQITALIAPRPVRFHQPSERAQTELAELTAWYRLWETEFDPLR